MKHAKVNLKLTENHFSYHDFRNQAISWVQQWIAEYEVDLISRTVGGIWMPQTARSLYHLFHAVA
jgi:hypothetical protein